MEDERSHGTLYMLNDPKFSVLAASKLSNGTHVEVIQALMRGSEKVVGYDKKTAKYKILDLSKADTDYEKRQVYYICNLLGPEYKKAIDEAKKPAASKTAAATNKSAVSSSSSSQQQQPQPQRPQAPTSEYTKKFKSPITQSSITGFFSKPTPENNPNKRKAEEEDLEISKKPTSFNSNRHRYDIVEHKENEGDEQDDDALPPQIEQQKQQPPLFKILTEDPKMPTGVTMVNSLRLNAWVAANIDVLYIVTDKILDRKAINREFLTEAGAGLLKIGKESSLLANLFLMRHAKRFGLERSEKCKVHQVPMYVLGEIPGKEGNFHWLAFNWKVNSQGHVILECVYPETDRLASHKWNCRFSVIYALSGSRETAAKSGLEDLFDKFLKALRNMIRSDEQFKGGLSPAEFRVFEKKQQQQQHPQEPGADSTTNSFSSSSSSSQQHVQMQQVQQAPPQRAVGILKNDLFSK